MPTFSLSSFVNNLKPLPRSGAVSSEPIIRPVVRRTGELAHSISKEVRDTFERRLPGTNSAPSTPSVKRGRHESFQDVVTGRNRANSSEGKRPRTNSTPELTRSRYATESERPKIDSTSQSTKAQYPAKKRTDFRTKRFLRQHSSIEERKPQRGHRDHKIEQSSKKGKKPRNSLSLRHGEKLEGTYFTIKGLLRKHSSLEGLVNPSKVYQEPKIRVSRHAQERISERGISSNLVMNAFTRGSKTAKICDFNVIETYKSGNAKYVRVVSMGDDTRTVLPYHKSESGKHVTIATVYEGAPSGILQLIGSSAKSYIQQAAKDVANILKRGSK